MEENVLEDFLGEDEKEEVKEEEDEEEYNEEEEEDEDDDNEIAKIQYEHTYLTTFHNHTHQEE